mgnify:FL=1
MFEMKETMTRTAVCPRCGKVYTDRPAISRTDDKTPICPDCYPRTIVIQEDNSCPP